MTQSKFENLSALVDGEHSDEKFLNEIHKDDELSASWQRYHLIRDTMREELPDTLQLNISELVAEALDKEPTVVAPVSIRDESESKNAKSLWSNVVPMFRQGGQFAIAASVAVAVILGYQQMNYTQPDSDLNIAPVKAISGIQSGFAPVSLSHETAVPQSDVIEKRRKLNALMADHQQQMMLKTSTSESEKESQKEEDQQK